jgi:hypothetical protein
MTDAVNLSPCSVAWTLSTTGEPTAHPAALRRSRLHHANRSPCPDSEIPSASLDGRRGLASGAAEAQRATRDVSAVAD